MKRTKKEKKDQHNYRNFSNIKHSHYLPFDPQILGSLWHVIVRHRICCARPWQQPLWEIHQTETDASGDVPNTIRIGNNREKQSTQYLTRFGDVPTSSGQGREILLIQQSITTYSFFKEFLMDIFSGIQYMRALAFIYSHRVLEF